MRLTRALAVALASVLMFAGTLLGSAGPAGAATFNTTISFTTTGTYDGTNNYDDSYRIYAEVTGADGKKVYKGSVTVYARPIGGTTWTPLLTNDSAYIIDSVDLEESFEYYAAYSGYTAQRDSENTYTASQTAPVAVNVLRGTKYIQVSPRKVCIQVGPLSAPYKNKPIHHYYKVGKSKKWKKSSYTPRTNKKSQYCYKVKKSGKPPKKLKTPKGPKLKASKTVYVKSGGMKKYVEKYKY